MAQVFRPTYTQLDSTTGKRVRRTSRTWWIRFYLPSGERRKVKGYRDKRATETLAAELERRAIREAAGLTDPLDTHAKRPLAEHLADYQSYLTAKGNTKDHVTKTISRAQTCLDRCKFVRLADVQPSILLGFLAELRSAGKGIATANYYLGAVKGFTRWLWKDKRAAVDFLGGMSKLAGASADVRRIRRDFSPEEMKWLTLTAEKSNKALRGLTGKDRRLLYLTAAGTGFRVAELAKLTRESFDLDAYPPTTTVHAAYTKNGQTAVQPLAKDLAEALRDQLDEQAGPSADLAREVVRRCC